MEVLVMEVLVVGEHVVYSMRIPTLMSWSNVARRQHLSIFPSVNLFEQDTSQIRLFAYTFIKTREHREAQI